MILVTIRFNFSTKIENNILMLTASAIRNIQERLDQNNSEDNSQNGVDVFVSSKITVPKI